MKVLRLKIRSREGKHEDRYSLPGTLRGDVRAIDPAIRIHAGARIGVVKREAGDQVEARRVQRGRDLRRGVEPRSELAGLKGRLAAVQQAEAGFQGEPERCALDQRMIGAVEIDFRRLADDDVIPWVGVLEILQTGAATVKPKVDQCLVTYAVEWVSAKMASLKD